MPPFIESSLMIMCSGSPSSYSPIFPTGLDTGCSISLPLLKVIMAWTSSIFWCRLAEKGYFMHSLRIGQCLGGEPPFFPHLLLIVQATDG